VPETAETGKFARTILSNSKLIKGMKDINLIYDSIPYCYVKTCSTFTVGLSLYC